MGVNVGESDFLSWNKLAKIQKKIRQIISFAVF